MTDDPATEPLAARRAAARRRRRIIGAGHAGQEQTARRGLGDKDPDVQAAALGALARSGTLTVPDIARALESDAVPLRRRAPDAALSVRGPGSRSTLHALVIGALADPDPLVVVAAAWFLGERRVRAGVDVLAQVALAHPDTRCRESAVAALGAIGDPDGLPAVLAALDDKPTVRRRATVALAAFEDPRAEAALRRSAEDRDWQVRQAADELRGDEDDD
ncbi:MAG TPA: HEAT repeat domain-containing protein [Acidimicrobiales bacterium]|nr:HEAT repeat domain-containing protein [Acidimicrobiales bacterium]